ncbi:MAG TPA: c-type cytochrome biogenesis protein CcmI [Chromatiales bacterium]|nr:c-type cytochrome biogenesis protein CcmI [Chromatiales bacterium]
MTTFWIMAALMLLAALGLLAPPLLGRGRVREQDWDAQNVRIARERLQELEAEFGRGALSQADYESARQELEQALLVDVEDAGEARAPAAPRSGRVTLLVLLVAIPALTVWGYLQLGSPRLVSETTPIAANQGHPAGGATEQTANFEDMVAKLAERLVQEPDNAEGWFMLGRSYMTLGRYAEAAEAFRRANGLVPGNANILLRYADALAMAQGGKISGPPFELIKQALKASPDDPTALWMAGIGYEEAGDYEQAVRHWRRLLTHLQDDPASARDVQKLIAEAEARLGRKVEAARADSPDAVPAAIRVRVELDPALRDRVKPDDTVFVFARALSGPPMPLAAVRRQVRDLPLEVTLDDAMAMMPQLKLSGFPEVRLSARISRTGNALAEKGDLEGEVAPVDSATRDTIRILIDRPIP